MRKLLGVIKALQLKVIGQDDSCGHHRTSQGTPPGLIDTRNGMDPQSMKLLLVEKRRALGFSPEALLGNLPETLVRHRVGCKNFPKSD